MSARRAAMAAIGVALAAAGCPQAISQDPDAGGPATPPTDASVPSDGGDLPDACVPATCADLPDACGELGDGCGAPLACTCDVARACSAVSGPGACDCPDPAFQARVADAGPGYMGLFNSLVLDASGGVHLAYVTGDEGFRYLHLPARSGGFTPTIEPVETDVPVTGTSLAVDAAGAVHVVYYRWSAVSSTIWNAEVWYARRAPGGGWTKARVVSAGQMVYARADYAAIRLDAAGAVHLLYYTFTYQRADLWHAWSATGTGWITAQVAPGTEIGSTWSAAGTVSLAREADGTLHALYFDYAAFTLRHASRAPGAAWVRHAQAVATPQAGNEWAGAFSSLVVDAQGALHATWATERPGEVLLWHGQREGIAWTAQRVDPLSGTARVGLYNALAADGSGGLHVAYWDSAGSDLKYAHRPAGGSWGARTAVSTGQVGAHAAIGVDAQGSVHAAFFELVSQASGTGQLRYATHCQ